MAKLYFYYASMNAGKSTTLLQADFNYRERGMATMLWTAELDHRAGDKAIDSLEKQLFEECAVILLPKPRAEDLTEMHEGQVLWGWPHCVQDEKLTQNAIDGKLTLIAWEAMNLWASDGTREGTVLLQDIAPGPAPSSPGNLTVTRDHVFFLADDGVHGRELWSMRRSAAAGCPANGTTLCLQGGRFAVTVRWQTPNVPGGQGAGHSVPVSGSDQTGAFWFFGPANVELLVKMIDGTAVNGSFWFFSGALSDVAYQIAVTDLFTGATRTYANAAGNLCGQADTAAFAGSPSPAAALSRPAASPAAAGSCASASPNALCLGDGGRFQIEVAYRNQHAGGATGVGTSLPGTSDSGFFWFFDPALYELAVKVLDGTALNGHTWLFYGALSDVEYTLNVTDTLTGARKTYHNPPGQLCGRADVTAF